MRASALLSGARRSAGLSQRELARRAAVPQSSISRIERGIVSPSVDTLGRLLVQCGRELESVPRRGEGMDVTLIKQRLLMTPGERLRRAVVEWRQTEPFRRKAAAHRG